MKVYVVGFGSGNIENMTLEARKAILCCDLVVGYKTYTDIIKKFFPEKIYFSTGMREERKRVVYAFEEAKKGKTVSIVCSGDSGVYGMAGLALEVSEDFPDVETEIVSGVTAALSGAAILGAPLSNDFTVISLSDLLTPWERIEKRLLCAAQGDFSVVIYNPSSKNRSSHLKKACEILLKYKSPETVCGYVKNIGRECEESKILSLSELKNISVDMFTTVFVGSYDTKIINNKMVTSRGYKNV